MIVWRVLPVDPAATDDAAGGSVSTEPEKTVPETTTFSTDPTPTTRQALAAQQTFNKWGGGCG